MALEFVAPPWGEPLDPEIYIALIREDATIKGLFIAPMLQAAKARGVVLEGARERYLPFFDYPVREHARLLVGLARALFPDASLRQGLRKLGRASLPALLDTIVGKVVWASVQDMHAALDQVIKAYEITITAGTHVAVVERGPGLAQLRMHGISWFLDSHHVGVFEGVLRACDAKGSVLVHLDSPTSGDFLVRWNIEGAGP